MESVSLIVLWNKRIIPWNKDCLWRIEEISHRTDSTKLLIAFDLPIGIVAAVVVFPLTLGQQCTFVQITVVLRVISLVLEVQRFTLVPHLPPGDQTPAHIFSVTQSLIVVPLRLLSDETKIPSIYASREDPESESRISLDSILLFFLSGDDS
jgi:hypothetical protein